MGNEWLIAFTNAPEKINSKQNYVLPFRTLLFTNYTRYEIKNFYPPADVLKNLADVFGTTIDIFVKGDNESIAQASLKGATAFHNP